MEKVVWRRSITQNQFSRNTNDSKSKELFKNLARALGNKYVRSIIGLIIIIIFSYLLVNLLTNRVFTINEFKIYGIEQVSEEDILGSIEKFKGKNFFRTSPTSIKSEINSSSIFFRDVYVEKVFPNKISVFVVERYPEVVLINFKGAFLVDQEDKVVKILSTTEGYDITNEEKELLNGRLPLDNKLVEDEIKEELSEDEKEEFDFESVDDETKRDVYDKLRSELAQNLVVLLERNSKGASTTEFANLDRVFLYNNEAYEIGVDINNKFTEISSEAINYIKSRGDLVIERVVWKDEFTLAVNTSNGRQFVFTDRRDIFVQLEDLEYMIEYLAANREPYRIIDLTSEVVSVE